MALNFKADIVHANSYFHDRVRLGRRIFQACRVFQVTGLTADDPTASTALSRARYATGLSIGQLHPDPIAASVGCAIQDVQALAIPQSDDAALVFANYDTIDPTTNGIGIISVERKSALRRETTGMHPTGKQITVKWPARYGYGRTPQPQPAEVPYDPPVQQMVITAAISLAAKLDAVRLAVRSVNGDGGWFGMPAGYWRFDEMRDIYQSGSNTIFVACEFSTQMTKDWAEYAWLRQEAYGQIVTVDASVVSTAFNSPYAYSVQQFDGISKVGNYPALSFSSLFGVSRWPAS